MTQLIRETMKKNMGSADRIIRVVVAAAIAVLYFTDILKGTLGIVLLVLAGVFLLTSLVGFCPLYLPFGLKTRKTADK
jgi:glycerol-3-phosphate acyltransferase PlsY